MYLLYTFILLTLVLPKNLDLSQFTISKELPENFKLNLKDENVNTRDEEILFTYDFEDGEEFTDKMVMVNGILVNLTLMKMEIFLMMQVVDG